MRAKRRAASLHMYRTVSGLQGAALPSGRDRSPTPFAFSKQGRGYQSKNWCFTSYPSKEGNPGLAYDDLYHRYLIVGQEICPATGTPHWQCFVQFHKKVRYTAVKRFFGNSIHCEPTKGSPLQNKDYCSKEGNFVEYGDIKTDVTGESGGKRVTFEAAKEAAGNMSFEDLLESEHADTVARCMQYFRSLYANRRVESGRAAIMEEMADAVLKPWQERLRDIVLEPPCPRKVYWLFDLVGNSGKSWMARYLVARHSAIIFTHGKLVDLVHAYESQPVVIVDLARTQAEKIDHVYMLIESLKNGVMFSSKYDSQTKIFKPPHVIVFANFEPERPKLSDDRWFIKDITNF